MEELSISDREDSLCDRQTYLSNQEVHERFLWHNLLELFQFLQRFLVGNKTNVTIMCEAAYEEHLHGFLPCIICQSHNTQIEPDHRTKGVKVAVVINSFIANLIPKLSHSY